MRRRLGQHFLKNERKIKQFVDALDLEKHDIVIEIGPGHGEVTKEIIHSGTFKKLVLIERDEKLATALRKKFSDDGRIEIVTDDALKILPQITKTLDAGTYKLVGNIPFYITGRLLRIISELEYKPTITILGIQKEVAERISAQPPRMNLLAASVQFWADAQIITTISRTDYQPQPEVDGAVIKLTTKEQKITTGETENYYKFIKTLFKQPRKTILNNLSAEITETTKEKVSVKLKRAGLDPGMRPQELSASVVKDLVHTFSYEN
ncbi:MAG TPA: ribosomal RNA small subunit methyltransferase A [Candidatus Jorgensenbacteria bacterium]|nr:ribosomal RNA small subunit methyltransferase A [Candidatus Jorgensenbacteria bacterium]